MAAAGRPLTAAAMEGRSHLDALLGEQVAYYRAIAAEYEHHNVPAAGGGELSAALEAFAPRGDVLELACGPGHWTELLLRHADTVTALDAAPEMLARAKRRIGDDPRVRFVEADVFGWRPDRRFDIVFFGFWLSHVPLERFDEFWSLVDASLAPGGRVFFADDGYRTPDELIEGEASTTIRRVLDDGTGHRIVKVPHTPAELTERLSGLGWDIAVTQTAGPFFWGAGGRATR